MAIRHTKTNNIPDPTQADLDAQIALGNYPPGTVLADISLPSDWNDDHTAPDIADVTGLQAVLDGKLSSDGVLRPEDFGCKGEFVARSQGIWDGTYFSDTYFQFTEEHVGWSFWQDSNLRTITAVTVDGKATLSPNGYGTTGINWRMMGQDDTVYFQRFLNACSPDYDDSMPDVTPPEPVIGLNGALRFGKVGLLTPGKIYPVSNSSASYSGGKLSALIVPRRIALACLSNAEHGVTIQLVPGSYGHAISNLSTTSYTDFLVLKNFTILCDGDFSPNSLDGFHIDIPYGNYDKIDPYNRFENIRVERPKRHGIYARGKGELKIRDCDVFNSSECGLLVEGQYDVSVIGGQFGGTGKTGLRIDSPGPIQITGVKPFYNGSNGGSNDEDCAGIVIEATNGDSFSGGASITEFEVQETRGVGLLIKVRECMARGVVQDPNRSTIGAASGRPTVKSAVYLKGQYACGNDLRIKVMPALTAYATPNWPADTSIIHIDGDDPFDSANGGPQNNTGNIEYPVSSILAGGGTFDGIEFTGTGTPFSGGGCTNGKNPHLSLNGIPFSATLGAAPASGDLIEVIDVSDTSASASGTKKLVEFSDFIGGAVLKSDYTPAHSLLVQQSGTGSPEALQIPNDTLVGRLSGGGSDIDALTATEVRTFLNVGDGADVAGAASSTDEAIARFDSTTGKLLQDSTVRITDNGSIVIPENSSPTASSAGEMKLFSRQIANRLMPAFIGPSGLDSTLQPLLARNKVGYWCPPGNATTVPGVLGFTAPTITGFTATSRSVATTNMFTRMRRLGYVSAATAAAVGHWRVGVYQYTVGGVSGLGGFTYIIRFGISDAADVAGARMFVGMRSSATPANAEPSTLTNCIGIGHGAADTNFKLFYGGSAAQTPIDLGVNFPSNTRNTDVYELALFSSPSSGDVHYEVTRLNTGHVATGTIVNSGSTVLPTNTTLIAPWGYRTNNATALAVGMDVMSAYIETDY